MPSDLPRALTIFLAGFLAAALSISTLLAAEDSMPGDDHTDRALVVRDEVFVEGELPAVPTANTVAAKLPLSLEETPASVSLVTSELFLDQRATILGDALRNVSGVNVQTGNGVFDFFVVRGLDSVSSGLILSDGAPEPETSFYQLYNVEQVEVLKGPAAFLYGGSPLGGTVNLVRKQPLREHFTRLGLSGGSFGTFEATLDANFANPERNLQFRLNGLQRTSDGYRDDKPSRVLAVNPALTWRPDARTVINANVETLDSRFNSDSGLPLFFAREVPDVPETRSYQSPFDLSDQRVLRFQLDIERQVSDRMIVRNKAYYRQLDWNSQGTLLNGAFPNATGSVDVFRVLSSLDDRQDLYGNQLEGLWQLSSGKVAHHLLVGLELSRLADEFTFDVAFLPSLDLFNPVETAQEPLFPIPGQAFGADARSDVLAAYVVDQITLTDRLQLLAGLRFDSIDFKDDRNAQSRSDDELSPMLGLVVSATPELSLYASYGEAFAPQSTFVIGEERIPETSEQIELGAKRQFLDGRFRATLAIYRLERQNIAIPDANGITQQTGDQRSEGLELELDARLRSGIQARLAYAYSDAELTEFTQSVVFDPFLPPITLDYSGNRPAFAPEHLLNVWISKRLSNGLGFGLGGRYLSEQFIAEDNGFETDGYGLLDAAIFYDLASWGFRLDLKNLADESYLTRGFGNTSVIPAPGFAAYAGVQYRL